MLARSAPATSRGSLVLNKIDKVAQADREALVEEFPAALLVSAKDPADVGRVRDAIIGTFEADMTDVELVVPYNAGSAIGEIHKVHVLSESYEGDGVHYRVRAPRLRSTGYGRCSASSNSGSRVRRGLSLLRRRGYDRPGVHGAITLRSRTRVHTRPRLSITERELVEPKSR